MWRSAVESKEVGDRAVIRRECGVAYVHVNGAFDGRGEGEGGWREERGAGKEEEDVEGRGLGGT